MFAQWIRSIYDNGRTTSSHRHIVLRETLTHIHTQCVQRNLTIKANHSTPSVCTAEPHYYGHPQYTFSVYSGTSLLRPPKYTFSVYSGTSLLRPSTVHIQCVQRNLTITATHSTHSVCRPTAEPHYYGHPQYRTKDQSCHRNTKVTILPKLNCYYFFNYGRQWGLNKGDLFFLNLVR